MWDAQVKAELMFVEELATAEKVGEKDKFSRKHVLPRPFSLVAGPAHLEQVI